jgi:1,4-dihydroxy-2-naphthoyl-CoA hydrolase
MRMTILKRTRRVRLHDTDAAGILFFANQFIYAHDIYEDFLHELGFSIASVLQEESFIVPIVHAESQYLKPLRDGDEVTISLRVGTIGQSSYVLEYELIDEGGRTVGRAKTVHVAIDKSTQEKIDLPAKLRRALEAFQSVP